MEREGGLGVGSNIPVARARNWEVYRWQCQEIVYRVGTKGGEGMSQKTFPPPEGWGERIEKNVARERQAEPRSRRSEEKEAEEEKDNQREAPAGREMGPIGMFSVGEVPKL